MSQTNPSRIYRATSDSRMLDLPRAQLTSGMTVLFVPMLHGMEALTGGGVKNLDGIPTLELPLPTVFDVLGVGKFSRWLLRAKVSGEETTVAADEDKLLVEAADDPTLIWERILGSGGSAGINPLLDSNGDEILDSSGNPIATS